MTKSLTEQWKDMDLADEHLYYWRMPNGEVRIMSKMGVCSYKLCYYGDKIDILAPVPSYEEYKKLEQQLAEANEVLEEYASITGIPVSVAKQDIKNFNKKWGVK